MQKHFDTYPNATLCASVEDRKKCTKSVRERVVSIFVCFCLMTITEASEKVRARHTKQHKHWSASIKQCHLKHTNTHTHTYAHMCTVFNGSVMVQGRRRWGCWVDENISSAHCHRWMLRRMIISSSSNSTHMYLMCIRFICFIFLSFVCFFFFSISSFLPLLMGFSLSLCELITCHMPMVIITHDDICKGNASKQEHWMVKWARRHEAVEVDMFRFWIFIEKNKTNKL